MNGTELVRTELACRKINAEKLLDIILRNNDALGEVIQGVSSKESLVKFACSKTLVLLSARNPELLYERIDDVIKLLDSDNQILKWNATAMLGNLAAVDRDFKIKNLIRKFNALLSSGELITANTATDALGKMALVYSDEQGWIVAQLLKIEHAKFKTDECRNIAIGKVIQALEKLAGPGYSQKEVLEFARRQTGNRRKATADKARLFLRRCEKTSAAAH